MKGKREKENCSNESETDVEKSLPRAADLLTPSQTKTRKLLPVKQCFLQLSRCWSTRGESQRAIRGVDTRGQGGEDKGASQRHGKRYRRSCQLQRYKVLPFREPSRSIREVKAADEVAFLNDTE